MIRGMVVGTDTYLVIVRKMVPVGVVQYLI
jgi:hypothetical protein